MFLHISPVYGERLGLACERIYGSHNGKGDGREKAEMNKAVSQDPPATISCTKIERLPNSNLCHVIRNHCYAYMLCMNSHKGLSWSFSPRCPFCRTPTHVALDGLNPSSIASQSRNNSAARSSTSSYGNIAAAAEQTRKRTSSPP